MEQLEQVEIDAFPTAFVTYLNVRRASSYLVNPLGTSSEYHSLMAAKFNSMHDTALFVTQTHNVGKVEIPTGLFINNEWHPPKGDRAQTIDVVNPTTGQVITRIGIRIRGTEPNQSTPTLSHLTTRANKVGPPT
ncbi:hypothetical protein EHS25_001834 [Saitozyma podzolica]|uniref:Uncharacterized protein n=1 Tax=Saitozyma podzolica TaxID=1890683 RepID=A0A427YFI2_9TREE|nr:hypothetical protein EHS25_001834 [Saitozyma podzolica]